MILFLVWPNSDRDKNILLPILGLLGKKHSVKIESIFNAFYFIIRYRPKVIVVANFAGSSLNHIVCKFAYNLGIKTVSLVSEGVIPKGIESALFWGANKEKILYVDQYLLWNQEMYEAFNEIEGRYTERFKIVGATGFDRYFLSSKNNLKQTLQTKINAYKRVVTYATWAFDLFADAPYFQFYKDEILPHYNMELVNRFREERKKVSDILYEFIKNNKDTFFILKYHPGTLYKDLTELGDRFKDLANVLIFEPSENVDLKDLIDLTDLWLAFESTTAMEAWLLNKPTIFINPDGSDFKRSEVHKGVATACSYEQLENMYKELIEKGKIENFERLKSERERIVKKIIGFNDGKSSERAAAEINNLIEEKHVVHEKNFYFPLWYMIKCTVKYLMSFFVKKYAYLRGDLSLREIE